MEDLRQAENWVEGFVKAAEAHGVPQEEVPRLLKIAHRRMLQAKHPEQFEAGYKEAMEKKGLLGALALMGLGGLGAYGIGKAKKWWQKKTDPYGLKAPAGQRTLAQHKSLQELAQQAQKEVKPFMAQPQPAGGGRPRWRRPAPYGYWGRY
jgi:hypothetical protein